MKKIFFLLNVLLIASFVEAQTGIGTTTPNASAKLDVSSSTLGFLPPRVTLTAANTFSPIVGTSSAATGLLVYNLGSVGLQAGYYYWNGSSWATIATASSPDQTVDYVSVGSIYLTGVGGSQYLVFPTNYGGNIPYNTSTGVFTLSANKTYLFQAQVRVNAGSGGNYIEYGFVDAVSNALLVNGTQTITSSNTAGAGYGSNPVINFIYTPSSNQTVKIRTTSTTVGTQTVVSGTANITQIGSSAIINPWTLSGTNTYNTTGNVGVGTNSPTSKLNISGGGIKLAAGLGNSATRPSLNTSSIGNYEIRGVGGSPSQVDWQDDGFLRLSAGGGTNVNTQSSIDMSGYSTVADMSNNIVMRTGGTERLRINNTGNVGIGNSSPSEKLEVNGNVKATNFIGSGSQLTDVATRTTGSWNVTTGNNNYSFTVSPGSYVMWVYANIPNGIIAWNATVSVTNSNVSVVGSQYAWVYNGGGTPIDFTSIPNQITGTNNAIVRSTISGSTSNVFTFGINNTSGATQTVYYGYIRL